MAFRWNPREHAVLGTYCLKWLLIAIPVGALVGVAVAFFLWALEKATQLRWTTDTGSGIPWLLFLLPLAGIVVSGMYQYLGKSAEGGNNLVIDQIHNPGGGVPRRMAPLVLAATVITHLFGGSAGREGTAVQMGGSIASGMGRLFRLNRDDTRTILTAGVAAGFGAVFGVPLAGAIFAVEVLAVGQISFESIVPSLIASLAGDWTTSALGIHHTHYTIGSMAQMNILADVPQLNWLLFAKVAVAAVTFGLGSVLFAEMAHSLQSLFKKITPNPLLRPVLGGFIVIVLAYLVAPDYLGIGVVADPSHPAQVSIVSSFQDGGATPWSWWWKTLFTTVTLSSGFKGGEVTPLFFIGATLGNTMASILHAPTGLLAGLGLVAVFAGATNTPLACTIMGLELFGGQTGLIHSGFAVYLATACFISYLISGHSGIYLSQRVGTPKCFTTTLPANQSLRTIRSSKPPVGLQRFFPFSASRTAQVKQPNSSEESQSQDQIHQRSEKKPRTRSGRQYNVSGQEIGQIRIYMTPAEKRKSNGIKKLFTRPLYQEVIDAAKRDGILNAMAQHTHYGYSGEGKIQADRQELPNTQMNLCVELIGHREQLERFCRDHGNLLEDKIIVYKHMEHWAIGTSQQIMHSDAAPEDLKKTDSEPDGAA